MAIQLAIDKNNVSWFEFHCSGCFRLEMQHNQNSITIKRPFIVYPYESWIKRLGAISVKAVTAEICKQLGILRFVADIL